MTAKRDEERACQLLTTWAPMNVGDEWVLVAEFAAVREEQASEIARLGNDLIAQGQTTLLRNKDLLMWHERSNKAETRVAELEREVAEAREKLRRVVKAITRFAYDIEFIPPWESAGTVWESKVRELLAATVQDPSPEKPSE